jgi:hypothetical protein
MSRSCANDIPFWQLEMATIDVLVKRLNLKLMKKPYGVN